MGNSVDNDTGAGEGALVVALKGPASRSSTASSKPPAVYSVAQARECLRQHRVVFFGDSVTRYHYLSLAASLEAGSWVQGNSSTPNSPCHESSWFGGRVEAWRRRRWAHWEVYFNGTNRLLGGNEVCDCARRDPCWADKFLLENRFYNNKDTGVKLAFYTWASCSNKNYSFRGHASGSWDSIRRHPPKCLPGRCRLPDMPAQWQVQSPAKLIRLFTRDLGADVVVFNCGLHSRCTQFATPEALSRAAVESVGPKGHAIWRTTSPEMNRCFHGDPKACDHPLDIAMNNTTGLEILDGCRIVVERCKKTQRGRGRDPYWGRPDTLHLACWTYNEWTQQLLHKLCG